MKHLLKALAATVAALAIAGAALAGEVGKAAPAFTLTDASGKSHSLADYRGKWVVLEWYNPGCPFVVKHYVNGDMQRLQKEWGEKGVVWLLVNSTNPNHRDYLDAAASLRNAADWRIAAAAVLLDPTGTVGKAYDARTTPHMYLVNPQGVLVYNGAIDSIRSSKPEDVAKAENFIVAALRAGHAGQPIPNATNRPYGCSVKYP